MKMITNVTKITALLFAGAVIAGCDSGVQVGGSTDAEAPAVTVTTTTPTTTASIDATPAFIKRGCGDETVKRVYCPD